MPNFWSTATQSIYECFCGPRTRDTEFDEKVEETKRIISEVNSIKKTILELPSRIAPMMEFCQKLYAGVSTVYNEQNAFYPLTSELSKTHKDMEKAFSNCCNSIGCLSQINGEWEKLYSELSSYLPRREEARKCYDHYDEKMEQLVKDRNNKLAKRQQENIDEVEKFDRVNFLLKFRMMKNIKELLMI